MLYLNSYYKFISFLYDKSCSLASPFLSMISNGIYIQNYCDIEIIILKSNFNNKKDKNIQKLIHTIENNLDKIKLLLLSKFKFGSPRIISMFYQKQLKFINNKLKIYIRNKSDLYNLFKIWFLLENEKNLDKFISRIDIFSSIEKNILNNELLHDINNDINEYVNSLIKKDSVLVLCKTDALKLFEISSNNLLKILSKHNVILLHLEDLKALNIFDNNVDTLVGKINKYLVCLDKNIVDNYRNLLNDLKLEINKIDISLVHMYCMFLDKNLNVNLKRIYSDNISYLLDKNFKLNIDVSNIFTSSLKENRYFVSDLIMDNNFSYDISDKTFLSNQKALNYGLDVYGISGRNNIYLNTNKFSINLGLELCLNRDISISNMICEIQSENISSWFCKNNKSLFNILNIRNSFFEKIIRMFVILTNNSTKIFDRNYIHGFSNNDEISIFYNSNRWPTKKILDFLIFKSSNLFNLNFNNKIKSFVLNNIIYNLSNKNIFIDNDVRAFALLNYNEEDLLKIAQTLDLYGYRHEISYSNILLPSNVINSLFSSKFLNLTYKINNLNSFDIKFMSRSLSYKNLIINKTKSPLYLFHTDSVVQIILENYCLLPVYSMIFSFYSNYFQYELETNQVISQRIYSNKSSLEIFSDTTIIKLNINSTKLLEKLYLKNISLRFSSLFFINTFNKNSYTYSFLLLKRNIDSKSFVEINIGSLYNLCLSDVKNVKIINDDKSPNFLIHNALFLLRYPDLYNEVNFDFIFSFSYNRFLRKNDILKIELISDILTHNIYELTKLNIKRFFDLELSYSKNLILIPRLGSLYLVFNFKFMRDNLSFVNFKFINNVY